ncbi:putative NFATC2-interacting protein [Scophthalmus maximus]|uniref:NFATC2-interacting protein n=1 Tax=Scophthalmus maximus TaxID=52904 RepID=A0A2U9CTQ8_SCOMX|nr:NFATC2-interacting protein isoform X1 [Scophthalmus maximus]XP_047184237.1 NFATC2-interacting protein isoform X1 [Scophthalmus maximus]AWP19513.1 putative NFATC2-interacting protein [Scophthalmus maximus]
MAESVSDGDSQAAKPASKRRRILDPSAVVPVPVYSNKVSSSLQLKPMAPVFTEQKDDKDDGADDSLWSEFSSRGTKAAAAIVLSDFDEEEEEEEEEERVEKKTEHKLAEFRCLSPSPPKSPVLKPSRQVNKMISEIDRRLQAVNSLLSPEPQNRTRTSTRTRSRRRPDSPSPTSEGEQEDDVIIMTPDSWSSPYSSSLREIPLKIRCRTDVHKLLVLTSTPLSDVLAQLSAILNVPPSRLLLLRQEVELPTEATVGELGLGIADIIECSVMAAEDKGKDAVIGVGSGGDEVITVRLQSKDRDSSQEFSLHRDAPLGSVFSQYLSWLSPDGQTTVRFHFDGAKVTHSQTPAQLDMEDGDIVEVWL